MMTDIEIAQSVKPRHILEIAKEKGLEPLADMIYEQAPDCKERNS